jgi:hypothetical protein
MSGAFTIDRAFEPRLLGAALGDLGSWSTWLAVLKAAFGLPLDDVEQGIFTSVAGNRQPPRKRVRELWAVVGRRAGKSRVSAALAVFSALFVKHKLAAGEIGTVLVLTASRDQAKTIFNYARGFLEASPLLAREVVSAGVHEIMLKNGTMIAVHSNSFRTVRGRTLVACVMDELSFWRDETSATPDVETYRAVLPSLATTNGMLIGISTPYRRMGLLHAKHRDHFGQDGDDVLVVAGPSKMFNPLLDDDVIAAQRAADPAAALAEWDAEFRADISAFLDDALIDAAVEHGRPLEMPPVGGVHYQVFADTSGGVGADSYTLAIGHKVGQHAVVDVLRGTHGGFDPQSVTRDYAELAKEYGIRSVVGDSYGAGWVAGAWSACGMTYKRAELPKSQVYLEAIPLFARGLVRLPDHARLLRELRLLERHTHRSGKDTVDHPRGGHDDHANAVCGVLWQLSARNTDWIRNFGLVAAKARMRPPYRRPLIERRSSMGMLGERRAAQMRRMRGH